MLIIGAAGAVGTFAVQLAKAFGAEVTGVCTTAKVDLLFLMQLVEAGTITPVIDRTYRLSEAPDAIRYLEQGHARGKLVITV